LLTNIALTDWSKFHTQRWAYRSALRCCMGSGIKFL